MFNWIFVLLIVGFVTSVFFFAVLGSVYQTIKYGSIDYRKLVRLFEFSVFFLLFQSEYVNEGTFLGYFYIITTHLVQGSTYGILNIATVSLFFGLASYLKAMSHHFSHEIMKTNEVIEARSFQLRQIYRNVVNLRVEMKM